MINNDTDLAMDIARELLLCAGGTIEYEGAQQSVKVLAHDLAQKLADLTEGYPTAVTALAIGALLGGATIRLTESAEEHLEHAQKHHGKELAAPDPDTHALAIFMLARRYINIVANVRNAAEEAKEHTDNGGQLS